MTDPLPYNLTISSQAASLAYSPLRSLSNSTDDGWVLSYSGGLVADPNYWGRRGIGADYHSTTRAGASVQISWVGTGIYFYGNASSGTYNIKVDGQSIPGADVPNGGLLGSKTGLSYKQHTATLSAAGNGKVAFQYAQATIGYGYPGNQRQNRTIEALSADGQTPNTQSFYFYAGDNNGWTPEDRQAGITYPNGTQTTISYQMKTSLRTDSLTFKVTNASGFILWGSLYSDHYPKRATLTPDPATNTSSKTTDINDICTMLDFQQALYWESGLDHGTTYTVQIANVDPDRDSFLAFNELQILDGGPAPPKASSSGGFQPQYIAAIVVPLIALAALIGALVFLRQRRRKRAAAQKFDYEGVLQSPNDGAHLQEYRVEPFLPQINVEHVDLASGRFSREMDAGPILPPEYDASWVGEGSHLGDLHTEVSSVEPYGSSSSSTSAGQTAMPPMRTKN
ncbi:hypothetical protein V5O48_001967 [Marasmius crinis-equi]|uniref:PA14 domain-containing protein n=1 Tax=Marasmius crinis-equi TaxID=585013 RepID=A0ABR3FY39_9AGAR